MDLKTLEDTLGTVRYRTGKVEATRNDLDSELSSHEGPTPAKFTLNFHTAQNPQHISVDIHLSAETYYANYAVIMSGIWSARSNTELPEALENEVLGTAVRDIFAPRLLSAATTKINDLARSIDCPTIDFDYGIDRALKEENFAQETGDHTNNE